MATKTVKLLLVENVDNLGIVGDVVTVRLGYARNYLLPRGLATEPDDQILQALAEKREQAKKEMAALRAQREELIRKMSDVVLTLERSCNDQGILYGSVTQQDVAAALTDNGYPVKPREVRLPQTIKRLGDYDIHIKLDADLETDIKLVVKPDRELAEEAREEMEFDDEGNLIIKDEKPAEKTEDTQAPAGQPAS